MKYGAVTTSFTIYQDYMMYVGGVYQHQWGEEQQGKHAVTVVGWGQQEGLDYWKV